MLKRLEDLEDTLELRTAIKEEHAFRSLSEIRGGERPRLRKTRRRGIVIR